MSDKDKLTFDKKTGEFYDPYKKTKEDMKARAKKKALQDKMKVEKKDIDTSVLKTMHDRINQAETEEEASKLEKRLKKYQEMFKK